MRIALSAHVARLLCPGVSTEGGRHVLKAFHIHIPVRGAQLPFHIHIPVRGPSFPSIPVVQVVAVSPLGGVLSSPSSFLAPTPSPMGGPSSPVLAVTVSVAVAPSTFLAIPVRLSKGWSSISLNRSWHPTRLSEKVRKSLLLAILGYVLSDRG